MSGRVIPFHQRFDRRFTGFATSKDRSDRPEKTVCPSSTWRTCQFDRTESDSDRVTAFPTRYPPSVSTDRPGIGSDRIWVRSFANTVGRAEMEAKPDPGEAFEGGRVTVGGQVTRRNGLRDLGEL